MKLNITEMLVGKTSKLRNIIRYSNGNRIHNETVAEHSFFTAYYAMLMAYALRAEGLSMIDVGEVATYALMHDLDECVTGDFIRTFKHSNPQLVDALMSASEGATKHLLRDMFGEPQPFLYTLWKCAKQPETIHGQIVAFADFLSVLAYLMQELQSGNTYILAQIDGFKEYCDGFSNMPMFQQCSVAKEWLKTAKLHVEKILKIRKEAALWKPLEK